ncbi:hypothetical protein SE91_28735 [Bradyrhizobium sp. DOA1]|nr:hypothetical protein SE91_28735 [Bradyrhizobium sp. DOA1]
MYQRKRVVAQGLRTELPLKLGKALIIEQTAPIFEPTFNMRECRNPKPGRRSYFLLLSKSLQER